MLNPRSKQNRAKNRKPSRRRLRPVLVELERRWLLSTHIVDDPGDFPLDIQNGPAETENGTITLRSAIEQVNIDGGGSIGFASAITITPFTPYDPITARNVAIVGPGTVVIDGSNIPNPYGSYNSGFTLLGDHDTLQDLVVHGFGFGDGVDIDSNDNVLVGDYLSNAGHGILRS